MSRVRAVLGLIGGACIVASGLAHSLLGWPQLRRQLVAASAPPDLVLGVQVGPEFGVSALFVSGFQPIYVAFIVPAVLLFAASR